MSSNDETKESSSTKVIGGDDDVQRLSAYKAHPYVVNVKVAKKILLYSHFFQVWIWPMYSDETVEMEMNFTLISTSSSSSFNGWS